MASGNSNRRSNDIPVSKKNKASQPTRSSAQTSYRYEDLVRREQQSASKRKKSDPSGDIYFDNRPEKPYKRTDYDYLSQFDEDYSGKDINVSAAKKEKNSKSAKKGKRSGGKKGKSKLLTFFKIAVIVILIAGIAGTGYLFTIFSNTEYKQSSVNSNSYVDSANLVSDKRIENILLIGVDERRHSENSRSDTMMLVSIDKKHRKIKLTSFMRDSYVTIPGYGEDRLNAACSHGGAQLVIDTIEYNLGIDIDHYMLVDFKAFKEIVNSLGGVTVEVEQREAEYINRTSRQNISYGDAVKLNGDEALVYVRIRYLDSDFYRTKRQRKVISAIVNSSKKTDPLTLIETGKNALKFIETDMSPMKLTFLSEGAALSYMHYKIVQSRVPFDGKYTPQHIRGMDVLCMDMNETSRLVKEFIYDDSEEYVVKGESKK